MIPAPITIGSHQYVVDLARMVRRPISSMRQQVDQGGEAGEQSLDNQALWKRTCSDFILGQGQKYFDQEQESNRRRFRAGRGIDCLAEHRRLISVPDLSSVATSTTTSKAVLLRTPDNWWAVPCGGTIRRSSSVSGSPAAQSISGTTAATDATVFGSTVYIAIGTGVYSGSATGTSVSSFSTEDCDVIDAALGRLVCGHDGDLFELDNAGARIDIFTHPNPQWAWTDFCAGSAGIYCAGTDGARSELYLVTVIDTTGALAPPIPVGQLPAGETIYAIEYFGGFLAMGTNRGVRIAQASQAGLLTYGPLVPLNEVKGIQFDGRFLYAACSYMPEWLSPGVVKLAMDRFTAPLTPAYVGGWRVVSNDPHRMLDVGVYEDAYYDRTYVYAYSTVGGSGSLWFSSDLQSRAEGEFWSGEITFGTPEPKTVRSIEIEATVEGTGVLTAQLWDRKGGTMYGTATSSGVGDILLTVTPSSEMRTESCELYLNITGDVTDISQDPVTVHRWTVRAVPSPRYMAEEIILPLMLAAEVESNGQTLHFDAEAEWAYLQGLMRSRAEVDFAFGNESSTVWVDQLGVENGWHNWDVRTEWPEGTVLVRLLTVTEA